MTMRCDEVTIAGYENIQGRCCCNCSSQRKVFAHPWNNSEFVKGSLTKQIGFACAAFEYEDGQLTFFESEHGVCEMHDFKGE